MIAISNTCSAVVLLVMLEASDQQVYRSLQDDRSLYERSLLDASMVLAPFLPLSGTFIAVSFN